MRSDHRKHDVNVLYKYATASTALSALKAGTLRWSSPLLFNDPFDVPRQWNELTFEELEQATLDRFQVYLRGEASPRSPAAIELVDLIRGRFSHVSVGEHLAVMRFFLRMMRKRIEGYLENFRTAWRERLPNLRVVCFSTDPSAPTMWAHYAKDHSGVVLGLESSDERDSTWLLAEPVIYHDDVPKLLSADEWVQMFLGEIDSQWDEILREYQYVKQTEWSYEKEYRVVSAKNAAEEGLWADYSFHPEDLRRVVLGARIDPTNEASVREVLAVQYPATKIFRAQLDFDRRQIHLVAAT